MKGVYSPPGLLSLVVFYAMVLCGTLCAQNSERVYSLDETLRELDMSLRWDPLLSTGILSAGDHRISFYAGTPGEQGLVLLDGRELLTLALPYRERGNLRFPGSFVRTLKQVLAQLIAEDSVRFRVAAIIVDPGHGGKDPGAVGTHTIGGKTLRSVEKDLTLAVSKGLAALLQSAYPEKRILLTRNGDTYPTLEDRVNIANTVSLKDNEAIIYISIHANASLNKSARGYEVWYLPPETRRELIDRDKYADAVEVIPILNAMLEEEFTSESTRMGRFILNRFQETLGNRIPSRGLKAENWYVVRNARMPAVLVELGFVTNPDDAALMADQNYLKLFSEGLYKGITDFVAEFEQSGGYIAP
ncbi:MAG: N-acetylmuramoyl-L-alanine amidase [Spirochaetaceae bacterium]|jgi:N-acetylmuramoyl-L-alanine amidase|nr:N-acetylmuramoyl-L-alanine amidase [Spirochaetaceae bacterium]